MAVSDDWVDAVTGESIAVVSAVYALIASCVDTAERQKLFIEWMEQAIQMSKEVARDHSGMPHFLQTTDMLLDIVRKREFN